MTSFVEEFCVPFLKEAQNLDGGWGYRLGLRSSVEPSCWALLALANGPKSAEREQTIARGVEWLHAAQLPNGSWPAQVGQQEGCWVTPLACLALLFRKNAERAVAGGTAWLCDAWPGEGGFWWRVRNRVFSRPSTVRQNFFYRGWSWTPGTSSWVEPTSYALILLRSLPRQFHPPGAAKRWRLGEGMLYDRMCPGGGWNAGNPLIYGVPGVPQVPPTVWALLALQESHDRAEIRKSLDWLQGVYEQIDGPGSLTLAHISLRAYGRPAPHLEPALRRLHSRNQFFHSVLVVAWATLALSSAGDWLRRSSSGMGPV